MKYTIAFLFLVCFTLLSCTSEPSTSEAKPEVTTQTISTNSTETVEEIAEVQAAESDQATDLSFEQPDENNQQKQVEKQVEKQVAETEQQTTPTPKSTNTNPPAATKPNTTQQSQTTQAQPVTVAQQTPKPQKPIEKPAPPKVEQQEVAEVEEEEVIEIEQAPVPKSFDHSAWNDLLKKHVSSSGKVNYSGFKNDKAALDTYLKDLANNPPKSSDSKNKKIAYWTNAYNAFTIQLIVNNYPVKSIMDLDGGNTWDKKRIEIGGKKYSLNQIEKTILLKDLNEPRVHFAVNCAAKSCPPLHNRAFTASNVQSKLEQLTRQFINNKNYNTLSEKRLILSKIFEWYASDFGDVKTFISKYTDMNITKKTKVSYQNYDWSLNN